MSKVFYKPTFTVLHTVGSDLENDISFQKAMWGEGRAIRYENLVRICDEANIDAYSGVAVLGFNQDVKGVVRTIVMPDDDPYTKIPGNVLITNIKCPLVAWAADCCLVALATDDGWVGVLHASVNTLKNGVVDDAVRALREVSTGKITAYVGACAGPCCYEYGEEKAQVDFADYPQFILPNPEPGKVFLDLHGAVVSALEAHDVAVTEFFDDDCRCTICSKDRDGNYLFPSFRRDVDKDGKHVNGQYGIVICRR